MERGVKVVDMQVVGYWTCQDLKNECPQYFAGLMEFHPNRRRAQSEMDAITDRSIDARDRVLRKLIASGMKDLQQYTHHVGQTEATLEAIRNGSHPSITFGSYEWALLQNNLKSTHIEFNKLPSPLERLLVQCFTQGDLDELVHACRECKVRPPSAPRKLKLNESKDTVHAIVPFDSEAPQGSLVVPQILPPQSEPKSEKHETPTPTKIKCVPSKPARSQSFKQGIIFEKNREIRMSLRKKLQKKKRAERIRLLRRPEDPMDVDDDAEVSTSTEPSSTVLLDAVVESAKPLALSTPISSDLDHESTIASASTAEMEEWFPVEDKVAEPKIPSTVTTSVVVEEEEEEYTFIGTIEETLQEEEEVEEVEEDAKYVGEALFYSLDSIEKAAPAGEEVADLVLDTNVAVDAELAESGDDSVPSVSTAELTELAILQEDAAAEVEEVEYPLIGSTIQVQVIAQLGEDDEQSEPLEEDAQVFFPPGDDDTALDHEVCEEDAHYVGAALFCREAAKKKPPRREKTLNNLDGAYWTAMPKRRLAKRVEGSVISSPTLRRSARIAALKGQ